MTTEELARQAGYFRTQTAASALSIWLPMANSHHFDSTHGSPSGVQATRFSRPFWRLEQPLRMRHRVRVMASLMGFSLRFDDAKSHQQGDEPEQPANDGPRVLPQPLRAVVLDLLFGLAGQPL
jgi:hypothetical protein